jgi:hypothetical protein
VKWCIGSSFFGGNFGCGTATLTSKPMGAQAPFYNFASTLSLPDISLSAGKYYLTLGSGTDILSTTPHNNDYWGATKGTSGDGEGQLVLLGKTTTSTLKNEPSFEVYGLTGSGGGGGGKGVPEPQTLLLLSSGLLSLALSRRRSHGGYLSSTAAAASVLLALGSASAQADSLLFDNGPDLFAQQPDSINQFNFTSDDFTLVAAATLDRVVFAPAVLGSEVPDAVNWCVGTSLFSKNIACGNATLSTTLTSAAGSGHPFGHFSSTFSLPNLALGAGKYYLTLNDETNVAPSGGTAQNNDYWAISGNSGDAETLQVLSSGFTQTFILHNEASFQIYGSAGSGGGGGGGTGVPEPQTLALLFGGLVSLALARHRPRSV